MTEKTFYRLPFGYAEVRIDEREPRGPRPFDDEPCRRPRLWRRFPR